MGSGKIFFKKKKKISTNEESETNAMAYLAYVTHTFMNSGSPSLFESNFRAARYRNDAKRIV